MRNLLFLNRKSEEATKTSRDNIFGDSDAIRGLSNLYSPEGEVDVRRDIADELFDSGKINTSGLEKVRQVQREKPGTDAALIVKQLHLANDVDILAARAALYGYKFVALHAEDVDRNAYLKLDKAYIKSNRIMPVKFTDDGKGIVLATSEPGNVYVIEEAKKLAGLNVEIIVCKDEDIDAVSKIVEASVLDYNVDEIMSDMDEDVELIQDDTNENEDLEQMAGESPVIKFVNYLISNALHEGASDIHIEPKDKYSRIRYRIDGVLFETMQAPLKMHSAVTSRLKIMSNLDISERRLPQDGKIAVIVGGRSLDLRVSTLPVTQGEKIVIRILDKRNIMHGLDTSGMEPDTRSMFEKQITLPHGIILVTGPTGSGKSTTLYSALNQMDGDRLNISTVEDPVEYELGFCNQVQTKESIGLSFSASLRSLLRQDPDIIMIGEIRDSETARIAVQAALTGHLVLSTLHTNDAPSSITRLINIGVDPYLIAASLNAVLAQRLVRKICENCKEPFQAPDSLRRQLGCSDLDYSQLYHGKGCDKCRNSGYQGRTGVYELLVMDDRFRKIINADASASNLQKAFAERGGRSLFGDGLAKIRKGVTTIEEILRVTQAGEIDMGDDVSEKEQTAQPANQD
jgi:type IV pilus assembly protein PilB